MVLAQREQVLLCDPNISLVAKNVKSLVEELKVTLEQRDDYQIFQLNLSKSESIDSIGITFLIGSYKTLSSRGKIFRLSGVSSTMMQLFKIMKLDEVFEFVND